tara:strand:- start:262 stop:804 length:543 start_codon:yes stop_codon:yes gene_type:complete
MNKNIITLLFVLYSVSSFSQKYISRNGFVQFNASTPLEIINPINNHVSSVFNSENGEIVFQMNMISFKFEKALMETHFNEKYIESEKYPKSTFIGKIKDWNSNLLDGENHNVIAVGTITIHGIEKEIEVKGSIQKNNSKITIKSDFELIILDFEIKIPKLVRDKISKKVKVEVNINLKQK